MILSIAFAGHLVYDLWHSLRPEDRSGICEIGDIEKVEIVFKDGVGYDSES